MEERARMLSSHVWSQRTSCEDTANQTLKNTLVVHVFCSGCGYILRKKLCCKTWCKDEFCVCRILTQSDDVALFGRLRTFICLIT